MKRRKREFCHAHEAAERLGISVDEVLRMVSTGELTALTFLSDDRCLVWMADVKRMRRAARRREARQRRGVRRRPEFLQLAGRFRDAIF